MISITYLAWRGYPFEKAGAFLPPFPFIVNRLALSGLVGYVLASLTLLFFA
jgi:hypothetical protein